MDNTKNTTNTASIEADQGKGWRYYGYEAVKVAAGIILVIKGCDEGYHGMVRAVYVLGGCALFFHGLYCLLSHSPVDMRYVVYGHIVSISIAAVLSPTWSGFSWYVGHSLVFWSFAGPIYLLMGRPGWKDWWEVDGE